MVDELNKSGFYNLLRFFVEVLFYVFKKLNEGSLLDKVFNDF